MKIRSQTGLFLKENHIQKAVQKPVTLTISRRYKLTTPGPEVFP